MDQEIFQNAISTLAQFTAFSIERFHKTAELLLIKERRSTVNEADALVQLTNILSDQINILANSFCDTLHQFAETVEKPNNIEANLERISSEVSFLLNNSSRAHTYIHDDYNTKNLFFSHRLVTQIHIFKMPLNSSSLFYKSVQFDEI